MSNPRAFAVWLVLALVVASGAALAQGIEPSEKPGNNEFACDGGFDVDIGPLFPGQPNGTFVTATADCSSTLDCNHYLDVTCTEGGEVVTASFCQGGGTADFDSGLSAWSGATFIVQEACNDDTCGLQSEISWAFTAAGTQRIGVDGFLDSAGNFTIAVNAPETCFIEGAPSVPTMPPLGLLALVLVIAVIGLTVILRRQSF